MRYLEDNGVISSRQFGFRQGKSCATNLLSFYTQVIEGIENRDGWMGVGGMLSLSGNARLFEG